MNEEEEEEEEEYRDLEVDFVSEKEDYFNGTFTQYSINIDVQAVSHITPHFDGCPLSMARVLSRNC
jgi:hypothetical protein